MHWGDQEMFNRLPQDDIPPALKRVLIFAIACGLAFLAAVGAAYLCGGLP